VSIVMVEQNARRCLQICHRGYVLDQGRNAYTGTGQELLTTRRSSSSTSARSPVIPATAAFADSHGLPDIEVQPVDVPTADDAAQVVVVHGVPGLEVDILAGGDALLEGFNFRDIEVLELPAGSYDLAVAAAGTTDPVLEITAEVEAGVSYTVAAYLDADGNPTIGASRTRPTRPASSPSTCRVPGRLDHRRWRDRARQRRQRRRRPHRRAGWHRGPGCRCRRAGSTDAAIDLGDVTVPEDTLLLVYALGPVPADDAADDAEEVEGERPEAVHSGTGGAATDTLPMSVVALMSLGALALAMPVLATVRKRR
jgi:hypothetical protein